MDTIYALASAQGKAGIAVIRVSGPNAMQVGKALAGEVPPPRIAGVRKLKDGEGLHLDSAMVLGFPGPGSFTGEDVVEFHVHGSVAIATAVGRCIGQQPGVRLAEPGEFTRRALENGRLDLTQVEGLADLIEAETESQRRQALRVLSGDLGKRVEVWRESLIRAAALVEATIDFADEDVPVDVTDEVLSLLGAVKSGLEQECAGARIAERIRTGFEVAIVGAPNVGKSSLLNVLAGRDAAITSEFAGTTRDVVEVRMDLNGLAVTFLDTAGIREATDVVEKMGIERAITRAESADLRVFIREASEELGLHPRQDDIVVQSKSDKRNDGLGISAKTGAGIPDLIESITSVLMQRSASSSLTIRARQLSSFTEGLMQIEQAQKWLDKGPGSYDIVAEEIRSSIRRLESVIGRVDVEHLLDEIFSSFCLGK